MSALKSSLPPVIERICHIPEEENGKDAEAAHDEEDGAPKDVERGLVDDVDEQRGDGLAERLYCCHARQHCSCHATNHTQPLLPSFHLFAPASLEPLKYNTLMWKIRATNKDTKYNIISHDE